MSRYEPLRVNGRAYPVTWDYSVGAIRVDVGGLIRTVYGADYAELCQRAERLLQQDQPRVAATAAEETAVAHGEVLSAAEVDELVASHGGSSAG